MKAARLFLAVDPAPAVRDRLRAALGSRCGGSRPRPGGSTSPPCTWTLSFLGDTEPARVPEISAAIAPQVARRHAPFELGCSGAGAFGGKRPRVLWAGVTGAVEALAAAQHDLSAALAELGFPPDERPFTAHLTLARAREARGDPAFTACAAALAGEDFGATWVEALVLYRSDLSPKGPAYTPLASLPLQGAPEATPPGR